MTTRSLRRPLIPILVALLGSPSGHAQFPGGGLKSPNPGTMSKPQQQKFSRAGTEDITNENFPETIESFDFPNADIADIVKAISELTGRNFMLDPGVRGKVTIIAPSKITVAEAYKMFLSALAIHGYAIVPSDGYYKIRPSRAAQRDSIETYSGTYYPNTDQMITKISHLKYISAEEVLKQFRSMTTKDGDISAYAPTNSLIISDYGTNVDRIVKIINQLDVPGFEDQIEVVPIRSAKAKDLAELIEKIVNKGQTPNNRSGGGISSGFQGAVPRFTRSGNTGASSQQGGAYFMAFPDERTNALIVVGNKAGIARVRKLVAQLDIRMNPADAGGVYVYYVKFGDAEKIAQVINGVAKDAGGDQGSRRQSGAMGPGGFLPPSFLNTGPDGQPQTGSGQIFGGDVKVTADKTSNSLVIVASKQDYEKVLNLLNRLDIAQDQVFVEAIITEMSMQDADSWKVGFYQYGKYGKGGFSTFSASELANLTSIGGGQGVIIPFADGEQQFNQIAPGQNGAAVQQPPITVPNILGFINFLKREGKANVLSTPRILALNNQEAQIKVVDRVPTSLATAANVGGQTSNITFEDAGIDLKIKPFISPASETIRMEITQLVSQPTNATKVPASLQEQATVITKREIKTNIVIRNGDTAVLGGLIREQETDAVSKVPLLGDIPVIGWFFKSSVRERDKINLMVFLTPRVIRNSADQKSVLSRALGERLDFIKDQGGRDPYGAKMDELRRYKADAQGNVRPTDPDLAPAPQDPGVVDLSAPEPTPAELEDSTVE
ncbi:MAG: type II secretion system secretin GspD [Bdellovibrionales bacterium]